FPALSHQHITASTHFLEYLLEYFRKLFRKRITCIESNCLTMRRSMLGSGASPIACSERLVVKQLLADAGAVSGTCGQSDAFCYSEFRITKSPAPKIRYKAEPSGRG
ncbi:MAG: hypothetical protein Q4C18_02660, partial [Eubacteriales bacterium]|nr:hypothetical protein [Eubacteriales bacterium]